MKIGIVGGGITGLVAADELTKKGHRVLLFEAKDCLGGLARSFQKQNWQWPLEVFFHHFFSGDNEVKKLIRDLGLKDKLFYKKPKTSVYFQGSIYQFDSPGSILKFPHLSWTDKAKMGSSIFFLRSLPFLPIFEEFSAVDIFPKLIGSSAWETIWQPLIEGKFGDLSNEVSFSWLWARLKKRSQRLGYLAGGCEQIITALEKRIKKSAGKILLGSRVLEVNRRRGGWELRTAGKNYLVKKIILALPFPAAVDLVKPHVSEEKLRTWQKLKSIGALTMILRLKRKFLPGDTYWLNILEREFPFIVLVEHTNFVEPGHYGGEFLVYVGGYYPSNNSIFNWNKKRVLNHFAPYLRRINPSFEKFLIDSEVFSSLLAQPIIPKNYSRISPSFELLSGEIYWATANHIYPWDRGVNFAIKSAKKLAGLV